MSLPTVTRASLGTRALQRANLQYSNFIQPDELNQLVDTSVAKLYNMLIGYYEDYFHKKETISLVLNQQEYYLPPDFMKMRQVFYVDQSGYQYLLRRMDISEITNYPNYTLAASPNGYAIEGDKLVLYPVPQQTPFQLLLRYIPQYTPPISDNQQIKLQFAFGWDEWIVNDIAVQIRNKAMMPGDELVTERMIIEKKLLHEAKNRNVGDAPRFKDTGFVGSRGRGNWGSWGGY